MVRSERLLAPGSTAQSLFEDVVSHAVNEDSRAYQTMIAAIIRNMLVTDWMPSLAFLDGLSFREKRRAGYLIEFAVRKIANDRERKRALFGLIAKLRAVAENTPHTTLYPNPAGYEYTMERNTDELAREWGLLDGATRSNILKMLKDDQL